MNRDEAEKMIMDWGNYTSADRQRAIHSWTDVICLVQHAHEKGWRKKFNKQKSSYCGHCQHRVIKMESK